MKVFKDIKNKFDLNFEKAFQDTNETLIKVELHARVFAVLGQKLNKRTDLAIHQKELIKVFDEIFSDLITSIYLASCAIDKPSQIVLRRILELSVTIVYLWDLPHEFWGWKERGLDLSFSNMLDFITSSNYTLFIKKENPKFIQSCIIDKQTAKTKYGDYSNVMHGRITTFETLLNDRFTYTQEDWNSFLNNVSIVQNVALGLYKNRFTDEFLEISDDLPAFKKYPI
jgi:hypothetical protein